MSEEAEKVVKLFEVPFDDVAAKLRKLADRIEAEEFGGVTTCAVLVMGDTLEIFGLGEDGAMPTIVTLCMAAVQKVCNPIAYHGMDDE